MENDIKKLSAFAPLILIVAATITAASDIRTSNVMLRRRIY